MVVSSGWNFRKGKEVSTVINEEWYKFMQNGEYKRYQILIDLNKPFIDRFQRDLMEEYQLQYFKSHPVDEELNRYRVEPVFKIKRL